jgi:hypothetical protein
MNTLLLIQKVTSRWLVVPSQTDLSLDDSEALLSGMNTALTAMWEMLPHKLRKTKTALTFNGPESTTAIFTTSSTSAYSIGGSGATTGQSVLLTGDDTMNTWTQLNSAGTSATLLWPYRGSAAASPRAITIYDDAAILPFLVTQAIRLQSIDTTRLYNLVDDARERPFRVVPSTYDLQTILHLGKERTLMRLSCNESADRMLFEFHWRPSPLTIIDTVEKRELEYPDFVCDHLIEFCGESLTTHPRFNAEKMGLVTAAREQAERKLSAMQPPLKTGGNLIGTPKGW